MKAKTECADGQVIPETKGLPPAYTCTKYSIVRQPLFFWTDQFIAYDSHKQKMMYIVSEGNEGRENITCYSDRSKSAKLLEIVHKETDGWDWAYRITDATRSTAIGWIYRREMTSMVRSHWDIANLHGQILGSCFEQNVLVSCLRRALFLLPIPRTHVLKTNYQVELARFHILAYTLRAQLQTITSEGRPLLDRRLMLALAVLLSAVDNMGVDVGD